jgi:hypothetical protein
MQVNRKKIYSTIAQNLVAGVVSRTAAFGAQPAIADISYSPANA